MQAVYVKVNPIDINHLLHLCKNVKALYLEKAILFLSLKNERVDLCCFVRNCIPCYESCMCRDHFLFKSRC